METAAGHVNRALALTDVNDPVAGHDRLRLELLAAEIFFYVDGDTFVSGGGESRLTSLAERLYDVSIELVGLATTP